MRKIIASLVMLFMYNLHSQSYAAEFDTNYIFFEHWRHYDSQGIACEECHFGPKSGVYTLPGHKECETCHPRGKRNDYEIGNATNCDKCHPKNFKYSSPLLNKVNRSGRSFYHSDRTHSLCDICHNAMLEDSVPLGQLLFSQDERDKIRRKSHRFHFVEDCKSCHSDNRNSKTKPTNHDKAWLKKGHSEVAPKFSCRICHTKSYCQNCHEGSY